MSLTADVCIVGSGPAGLLAATELVGRGLDVVLLESGARDWSAEARRLAEGEVEGDPIHALDLVETRHRQVGGNANLWVVKTEHRDNAWVMGVRYGTLTEADFAHRPWVDHSGWPISRADLEPWYRKAHERIAVGSFGYEASDHGITEPYMPFERSDFDPRVFMFGPRDRFLSDLRGEFEGSDRGRLVAEATAVGITQAASGDLVRSVEFRDRNGQLASVDARYVVLAGGAVENARLMLASERERGGIGNETDNVGRYFQDHPLFSIGDIEVEEESTLRRAEFFDLAHHGRDLVHGHVVTSASLTERLASTQIGICLFPRPKGRHTRSLEALKEMGRAPSAHLRSPSLLAERARAVMGGIDYLPRALLNSKRTGRSLLPGYGRGGWSADPVGMQFTNLEVVFQVEQAPEAESRVTLSQETDRFGSPRPKVVWRLGDQTRRSVLATQGLVAEQVDASGLGRYVPRAGNLDELLTPSSMAHHVGTTRMSRRPEDGVVDADCRVHTAPNLFIAGSSVFPTSSYVNPTLSIAAISMRLADAIAREA